MTNPNQHILLADDDQDDCLLFRDAVEELELPVQVTTVENGEQLMRYLSNDTVNLPKAIFLDLNMPRKNGFACLAEIKSNKTLSAIPVIIFSTSYNKSVIELLYKQGAHHYICKPTDFKDLKKVLHQAFALFQENDGQPVQQNFLITPAKEK